jgi:hypothetical protein
MSKDTKPEKTTAAPQPGDSPLAVFTETAAPAPEQPKPKPKPRPPARPVVNANAEVTVVNAYPGTLIYKSARTGERFIWRGLGTEHVMTFAALREMKNTSPQFFERTWIKIEDADVLYALGVAQHYKNALGYGDINRLLATTPEAVAKVIEGLSLWQKQAMIFQVKTLVANDAIDSIKMVQTLEKALGITLLEA